MVYARLPKKVLPVLFSFAVVPGHNFHGFDVGVAFQNVTVFFQDFVLVVGPQQIAWHFLVLFYNMNGKVPHARVFCFQPF